MESGLGEKPEQYKIDDAVNTLLRAEEIKADSDLMKEVGPALAKKHALSGGLKSLWKDGLAKAQERESREDESGQEQPLDKMKSEIVSDDEG